MKTIDAIELNWVNLKIFMRVVSEKIDEETLLLSRSEINTCLNGMTCSKNIFVSIASVLQDESGVTELDLEMEVERLMVCDFAEQLQQHESAAAPPDILRISHAHAPGGHGGGGTARSSHRADRTTTSKRKKKPKYVVIIVVAYSSSLLH